MPIKFQSHRSANSPEYQSGAPGDWGRIEERVPEDAKLTQAEEAAGFALIPEDEWVRVRAQNEAAFKAWEASVAASDVSAGTTRKTEADGVIVDLQTIVGTTGSLNAAQLSAGLRACARALLLLREKLAVR